MKESLSEAIAPGARGMTPAPLGGRHVREVELEGRGERRRGLSPRLCTADLCLTLSLALTLTACGGAEPSGGPDSDGSGVQTWSLVEPPLLHIGVLEGEEPYQLHQVSSAIRLADGRIVVANDGSKELRFFGPDGRFLFARGGAGEGPAMHRILDRVRMGGADSLLVLDTYQHRISVLDPETGEYLGAAEWPEGWTFPLDEWVHGRNIVDSPLHPRD